MQSMSISYSNKVVVKGSEDLCSVLSGRDTLKIVILGAGAMGMLFGGYLSRRNDVTLVDVDKSRVDAVNRNGIVIKEADSTSETYHPHAVSDSAGMQPADLVILFVKSLYSRAALSGNLSLIGPHTDVMTLQNGSGHEEILREFVPEENIIIGMTQHNSSIISNGCINHGGTGKTSIGSLTGNPEKLQSIAACFSSCGFDTSASDNVQKLIWNKMFLNVSASVLTAVLQVKLGYLVENEYAWQLTETLIREAVTVANGDGMGFDADDIVTQIRTSLENSRNGYTSIYADIRDGRKSEVDTISGSVVRAGKRNGTSAPSHELFVKLIHAMEDRSQ